MLAACSKDGSSALTVGSAQYYSNEIVAEAFAQVLEQAGFSVDRQFNIGAREVFLPELESGKIDVMPEYGGNLLQYYDKSAQATSSQEIHTALAQVLPEGLKVLDHAPATDQDSYTVTKAFSQEHGLTSIGDLAGLGRTVKVASNAELTTRPYGPEGVKRVYGVDIEVVPVEDSGGPLTVKALVDGEVDAANVYTADPVVQEKDLVVLEDPSALILPQNITPLVSTDLPEEAATAISKVTAVLTTDELRGLNARSTQEQLDAQTIATQWLTAKGLLA